MSKAEIVFLICTMLGMFGVGFLNGRWSVEEELAASEQETERLALDNRVMEAAIAESHATSVTQIQVADEFAVTSKPRHVPWSIRKKELEQEARQKRRQLESFREPQ